MEELYASDKISLYKYYPISGALGDEKHEFALQKKAEETPISLLDTQFLMFEKGLANYFNDCEDLKIMCENGKIALEEEDLLKAARIYSEVCSK